MVVGGRVCAGDGLPEVQETGPAATNQGKNQPQLDPLGCRKKAGQTRRIFLECFNISATQTPQLVVTKAPFVRVPS